MIQKEYVSFETAKLLKEKGFNEECFALYNPDGVLMQSGIRLNNIQVGRVKGSYSAPTQQMAMRWLREVHNIHISITFGWVSGYNAQVDWAEESEKGNDKPACCVWRTDLNTTYEAAVEAAIKYCLENLI